MFIYMPKLRSLILKLGFFATLLLSKFSNQNKTAYGDKTQVPPLSHQGLMCLSLLPKQQISRDRP